MPDFMLVFWEWILTWGGKELGIASSVAGIAAWLGFTPTNARYGWRRLLGRDEKPQLVRIAEPTPVALPPTPPLGKINLPSGRRVVGREHQVAELRAKLCAGGEVAITHAVVSGHGGFGKSTLARYYGETYLNDYHAVVWLPASNPQELIDAIVANLWVPLGLPVADQPEVAKFHNARAVLDKARESGKDWLFIYVNVESLADIENLLPVDAHLIVTTRQGQGWTGWGKVEAGVLGFATEDAPAVDLLIQEVGLDEDRAGARSLAEALGGLPLALVLAGALIRAQGGGFADYEERLADVIAHQLPNGDYPVSLIGAVQLSYGALSTDAKLVADICAWWAAEGLGPELICGALAGEKWAGSKDLVPEAVQGLAADAARVKAGFAGLAERSLTSGVPGHWAMHRMTAAALRALPAARGEERGEAAAALLASVYSGDGLQASKDWSICARLTPHVRAMWESGMAPRIAAMDYVLNQAGIYLDRTADYSGAALLARANLEIRRARLPEAHRDIAVALANLGAALVGMEQWV